MITLITGGIKSGKSDFALSLAEDISDRENLYFLATAQPMDAEMAERIEKHKANRKECWNTIEEPEAIAQAIEALPDGCTVLIDCITLWLNNILGEMEIDEVDYDEIKEKLEKIVYIMEKKSLSVIFVTNEVGSGIIPDNKLSRIYIDILGKVNQVISGYADEVYWMVSGISVKVKPGSCIRNDE